MNLSSKATRFVIEALEHYQKYHDERLGQKGLSEDEAADLANDRQLIDAIKQEFLEYEVSQMRESHLQQVHAGD